MTWLIYLIIIGCILAIALSHFARALFSAGFILSILISFTFYYWLYYLVVKDILYWIIPIDIFFLGILVSRNKKHKLLKYCKNFIKEYLVLDNKLKLDIANIS